MSHKPTFNDIQVSVITDDNDLAAAHDICCACFGVQNPDAIHAAFNPLWETVHGREAAIQRSKERFAKTANDDQGRPIDINLKATIPAPASLTSSKGADTNTSDGTATTTETSKGANVDADGRIIVGFAVWGQCSDAKGQGESPDKDMTETLGLDKLYPDDAKMQRCVGQLIASLTKQRNALVRSIKDSPQPAIYALNLCVVDPEYQGIGAGYKLVQWGLDEAKRRGDLECVLEATPMGRNLYQRMGFVAVGEPFTYDELEDKDFMKGLPLPANIFMRTRPDTA